ncbi:MAG: amidohydrolase family protein [Candidatus Latescibacteria bacterium]|nr:amidohydrolase family protein [Candidatus Latescibacterota bacterium]
MIIDAHTHIGAIDFARYPLANPASTYRPTAECSAEVLRARMQEAGIDRAFTITPGYYGWDNRYPLDALEGNEDWLAVGVLVDPLSPQAPRELADCVGRGACGLRIQQHLFYHEGLDNPAITPLWAAAAELGLPIDVNATHEEYPQVERRLRQFPQTTMILDHCGYVSGGKLRPQQNTVAPALELARYPNACAKLSFIGLASEQAFPFRDVHWMVREVVDAFGPERCMWGSNFPVPLRQPRMTCTQTVALFAEAIDLSREEREWILGGTAQRLWKWAQ